MAMDYLPIQVTSVPCEYIFSSAKEMDTAKWNQISLVLMEVLQLLKFSLKKEQLNFTDGWLTSKKSLKVGSKPNHGLKSLFGGSDSDSKVDAVLKEVILFEEE
ncbi:hypothetical protein BJV77DRAFT_952234 [Russula vinacea]|nr:hypothetical protein BJV77DRAFT_952234 [Russula vinacea]